MKYAIDLNLDEWVTVEELLEYYPIALKYHRFACPKCDKRVTPVKAVLRKKHFKHLDGSPNCPDYFGGGIYDGGVTSGVNVSRFPHHSSNEIFEFVGFERFYIENCDFSEDGKIKTIDEKYYPDLTRNRYYLWLKPLDELESINFDINELIRSIILFSEIGNPVLFVLNPILTPYGTGPKNPLLDTLVNRIGVVFEIPLFTSVSHIIRVWILDSAGEVVCPGKTSFDYLIKKTKFSYKALKTIIKDLGDFVKEETFEYSQPRYTYTGEDLILEIKCSCGQTHVIYVVCNVDYEVKPYLMKGPRTFSYVRHMYKFKCDNCERDFYTFEEMKEAWADKYIGKQKEKQQFELQEILDEGVVEDTEDISIKDRKVKIRLGEYVGEIGTAIMKENEDIQVRLDKSNEIIEINEKFVINL